MNASYSVTEESITSGQIIMPFYIVCDVSSSMAPDMGALNKALEDLVNAIRNDPVIDDMTMISVISFSNSAQVEVPLQAPSEVVLPVLSAGGGTFFGSAWEAYHHAFEWDSAELKALGCKVFRPCVFFLTDGEALDGGRWQDTFQRLLTFDNESLTGNAAYPYVCAFGFRDASEQSLAEIAYPDFGLKKGKWFMSHSEEIGQLLAAMADVIGRTVISSGQTAALGRPTIVVEDPENNSGITMGEAGAVDAFV